jgi:hypothetical protein
VPRSWNFLSMLFNDAVSCSDYMASVTDEWVERSGGMLPTGETEVLWEKPVSVSLCPLQIPYGLAWNWGGSSAMERRWITAGAMARTQSEINDRKQISLIRLFRFVVLPSSTYLFTVGCGGFLFSRDHTQTHTVGRSPLNDGSARRRDLYLTTQTLYKRWTSMPPVGFEPTIPASARPQTYALDHAATGIIKLLPLFYNGC